MLIDVVDVRVEECYEIIRNMWEKLFINEELELSVSTDTIIYSEYARTMVILNNDEVRKGQLLCEEDFEYIAKYLITLYRELHNDNVISRLNSMSIDDFVWEDYKTYIKCMEGDNSPLARAYTEEIIDVLEKGHTVGLMSTRDKIDCLNDCIDNYYNIPLDGFDSDVENMTNY